MKKPLIILAGLVVIGAGGVLLAADPPAEIEAAPVVESVRPVPTRAPSPMFVEINASVEEVRRQVKDLERRYHAAVDDDEAMAIMREVSRVKREGRIEILRIQLRHARQDGRMETVAKLETAITKMTTPPVPGRPIVRPAPRRDTSR